MLGTTEVSETNMLTYLGLIEQRANEILQQRMMNKERGLMNAKGLGDVIGPQYPPGIPASVSIIPPSTA